MKKSTLIFFYIFLVLIFCNNVFAGKNIMIQIDGKYIDLKSVDHINNLRVIKKGKLLYFIKDGKNYLANDKNILGFFPSVTQLNVYFRDSFSNARIYLDTHCIGKTNSNGIADITQKYPEAGKHTLSISKNKIKKTFSFNLITETPLSLICSGKNNFNCSNKNA